MRLVMRTLVVLALPVVALGWLASAPDVTGKFALDPPASTAIFMTGGFILLVAGSIALAFSDFARALVPGSAEPLVRRRPIALPVVLLTIYVGFGELTASHKLYGPADHALFWLSVALTIGFGFGAVLAAAMLARALLGMWSRPELPLFPGRRAAVVILLLAAFASTPVGTRPGAERLDLELLQ
jgi:hypothetical protein